MLTFANPDLILYFCRYCLPSQNAVRLVILHIVPLLVLEYPPDIPLSNVVCLIFCTTQMSYFYILFSWYAWMWHLPVKPKRHVWDPQWSIGNWHQTCAFSKVHSAKCIRTFFNFFSLLDFFKSLPLFPPCCFPYPMSPQCQTTATEWGLNYNEVKFASFAHLFSWSIV